MHHLGPIFYSLLTLLPSLASIYGSLFSRVQGVSQHHIPQAVEVGAQDELAQPGRKVSFEYLALEISKSEQGQFIRVGS